MNAMKSIWAAATILFGAFVSFSAFAFTVTVVDQDGNPIGTGFKWLLEEDNTHPPQPGVHLPVDPDINNNTLSISLHRSHAPVLASGESAGNTAIIDTLSLPGGSVPLQPGRYFISVLPFGDRSSCDGTYDMGGQSVTVVDNSEQVTVYVRQNPIETAQVSVKVFHDIAPLNNAPDVTEIDPVNNPGTGVQTMEGFTITLTDAAGDIVQDAFGNKLGTTYQRNPDGSPVLDPDTCQPVIDQVGSGDFVTPPNGEVFIKNVRPNKYGVQVEPPGPDCVTNPNTCWRQVTTIEGTQTIDAWVRPNEPPFLVEFGPPFWHAFYGFVKPFDNLDPMGGPAGTVTGTVRKGHLSRPPAIAFTNGPPPEGEGIGERCLIGLNRLEQGFAEAVWIGLCENETGNFTIPNVPPGTYQLVIWDISLLHIISFNTVIVPDTGGIVQVGDIDGNITTPMWFGQHEHYVFADKDKDARRDCVTEECNSIAAGDEVGIPDQNINLRFRDGTIYQAFPTDTTGFVPFQEVFPFFHWQVAEVDFTRDQATGVRVVVDDGGLVTNDQWGEGKRNPQIQANGNPFRREVGPALLEGYQIFAGQNTRFEWGKAPYDADLNAVDNTDEAAYFASIEDWPNGAGDIDTCTAGALGCDDPSLGDGVYQNNGGISGIVFYAVTRAENDPRLAAGEEWEPGVPRVQVNLYRDVWCASNGGPAVYPLCPEATPGQIGDGIPDDRNGNGSVQYADVDNYPFNWANRYSSLPGWTGTPGPEDIDHNGNGNFNVGDAIAWVTTDSWDDSLPEGCVGNVSPLMIHGDDVPISQCAEGLRTWNQVRPAVFDGGYAFGPEDAELVPGTYIVEAATPPGYKVLKEEDRNVDFGTTPIPAILPPVCVGDDHLVPPLFSFLTDDMGNPLPGVDPDDPDNEAPFAGETRRLCNRKKVDLGTGQNSAADFFVFTDVPKAARAVGLITDDFANELAPGKPSFTEKFSPPWMTIAVFDYTGRQLFRASGDEFGAYNFLAPSSYNIDLATPSGVGPKMNQFCLNHPGPVEDPNNAGTFIVDPRFRAQYSTTCYTFNFEVGRTTYLDTPVIRQAAFVGALQQTLDCEAPNLTPAIRQVINLNTNEPAILRPGAARLRIFSPSGTQVRNPAFPGDSNNDGIPDDPPTEPEFITRQYGFGGQQGQVCIGDYCFSGSEIQNWGNAQITLNLNQGTEYADALAAGLQTGQLRVTRSNGNSTTVGLTVTVDDGAGSIGGNVIRVACGAAEGDQFCTGSIQDAIDAANDGDLILVDPGVYAELPILYKRVKLQGAGAGGTTIWGSHFSAGPAFANPLVAWREKLAALVTAGDIGVLPEQDPNQPDFFFKDGEGPGIFVAPVAGRFSFTGDRDDLAQRARIDGFNITLADLGGAIYVNAYANRLLISNNELTANAGNLGGGIRVGNPTVVAFARGGVAVETSPNPGMDIRYNDINQNGTQKTGGGIALYKGADNYAITENLLCGNFARSGGGAIAHRGLSNSADIMRNQIIFNEVFQGDQPGAGLGIGGGGGGIEVAGDPDPAGGLTEGTGNVNIVANLIQGNLGGAADGGGIALRNVNGDDVVADPNDITAWHRIQVLNNLIVNNVSGLGGGGMALQDATRVRIVHNTIAHNDSTATGIFAFEGGPTVPTTPQPAGIVSRAHSTGLVAALAAAVDPQPGYSEPTALRRNILSMNRTFRYDNNVPALQPNPAGAFWDLGVITSGSDCLAPTQSVLTDLIAGADPSGCNYSGSNNFAIDPVGFVSEYFNTLVTAAAADEGGNFVQVYYTPLGRTGNYHLSGTSPAIDLPPNDSNTGGLLATDVDGQPRPSGIGPDTGADEVQQ